MAFPEDTINLAWQRSGGRCECKRNTHDHNGYRCTRILMRANRGRDGTGAWEAHHISTTGGDVLSNCEILCWSCHKKTTSFG